MLKAYKYRVYPNTEQSAKIDRQFGCCRYVYNWGLQRKMETYTTTGKTLKCFDLIKELTQLKKELTWLSDTYSQSLQMALRNLDNAYVRFFREKKGFPKFKSRKNPVQSCQYPQGVQFRGGIVFIPKVGKVRVVMHREFHGTVKTVTLSRTAGGKHYISVLVDDKLPKPVTKEFSEKTTVGIDVGLKHFAVLSTGEKVDHPQHAINAEKKLRRLHKKVSRRKKGSNNKNKARIRLAVQYEKVAAKQKDFLHKLSRRLISENQAVAIEDLHVQGMLKNRKLARHISASSWSEFFTFLDYKSEWYGTRILRIGRFDPSSKTCHICGFVNGKLKLGHRVWTCTRCGNTHDRDVNAAKNIKAFALSKQNTYIPGGTRESTPVEIAEDLACKAAVPEAGSPTL